ncbi:apaG protein [Nymphaea thermarum]|nr:apaG protein [Nymphaea thermarum]
MEMSSLKFFAAHSPSLRKPLSWSCNYRKPDLLFRVVASSSQDNGGEVSQRSLSRRQTYALLKQQMAVAAKSEDYKEAARIRDSLRSFEEEEPVLRLRRMLKEAVEDERFEVPDVKFWNIIFTEFDENHADVFVVALISVKDAAKFRDELQLLAPSGLLKCSSDATTLGIQVHVKSIYIEGRSQPSENQFFFAYRIRITNNSERPVQLLRRHWIITDGHGKIEHVWGMGVIGEQPVIHPRTNFEYSSACPLGTSSGKMEGEFEMRHVDKANTTTFSVVIAPFALSVHDYDIDEI